MTLGIRKISTFLEETHVEGGKAAARPVTMVVVAAVIQNPWAGRGFVENLRPEIIRIAGELSHEMTSRLLRQMDAEKIEACGKAAAVGINGEIEHASAMIHTLRFGNPFRHEALDRTWLTSTVIALAACIDSERAFDRMPILADALQDAGCDNVVLLAHCRDTKRQHVRGCWVVDLLLGKS